MQLESEAVAMFGQIGSSVRFWCCVILGEGAKPLDRVKGQNPAFPTLTKDKKETKDPTTRTEG